VSLVESLLTAIVRLEGDALVMHVGEKPYVVTTSEAASAYRGPLSWGQVELSTRTLTVDAVAGMLAQLLPEEQRKALVDVGAVEYALPEHPAVAGRFTVIAARGGDDIWLEIRHLRPVPVAPAVEAGEPEAADARAEQPEAAAAETAAAGQMTADTGVAPSHEIGQTAGIEGVEPPAAELPVEVQHPAADQPDEFPTMGEAGPPEQAGRAEVSQTVAENASLGATEQERAAMEDPSEPVERPEPGSALPEPAVEAAPQPLLEATPEPVSEATPEPVSEAAPEPVSEAAPEPVSEVTPEPVSETAPEPVMEAMPEIEVVEAAPEREAVVAADDDMGVEIELEFETAEPVVAGVPAPELPAEGPGAQGADEGEVYDLSLDALRDEALDVAVTPAPPAEEPPGSAPEPAASEAPQGAQAKASRPAVVLPLTRQGVRGDERDGDGAATRRATIDRLLRVAAARGASNLYIVTGTHPVIRVGGEIQILDAEEALGAADVAAMLMELAPENSRDALQKGAAAEWLVDVADVGRIRCMSFRDHRGPGGIFRMLPARALSVEHLGLSREIQALCRESEGLVLVAGPRSSGKSTLVSAFVDLINRTRADHVITFESQINFVHESRRALVSQRELRGDLAELRAAVRAALREDPDVLVIEDLRTPDVMAAAIEAAESGRLVFGALPAASTVAAIERIMDQFVPERRAAMLSSLASTLRGVVSQVLLRKIGGGRVAAREILLSTPSVAALIAEGQTRQLLPELDAGRKLGMAPLNDALVSFVRSGAVSPAEAYRKSADREGLLVQLSRERIDTSFVERLG